MTHAYDNPSLSAVQFLLCVMRNSSVSIVDRVHAAHAIAEIESITAIAAINSVFFTAMMHKQWQDFCTEQQSYFSTWPEHEQQEFMSVVQGLERCNELDVGNLKLMSVKGHA